MEFIGREFKSHSSFKSHYYLFILYINIYNMYIHIYIYYIYIHIHIYIHTYIYGIHHWRFFKEVTQEVTQNLNWIWTHNHGILANFVQLLQFQFLFSLHVSFRPLSSSVTTLLREKSCTSNHVSGGINWYIWSYGIHHWSKF